MQRGCNRMLDDNGIKEQLSYAYIHAIASKAGFSCERPAIDRDSVDAVICARRQLAVDSVVMSPRIEIQLKATSKPDEKGGQYVFFLPLRAYDDLRGPTMVPRFLVLLVLPKDKKSWVTHHEKHLISRRCAYWCSLKGAPESANSTGETVYIPKKNALSPDELKVLLVRASRRQDILYET